MNKKQRALTAVEALEKEYPNAECSLATESPFELLIAVRLSAQCTDARVNLVTPELFSKYKTLDDYAGAKPEDIESIIHSCGFFRQKAKDIIGCAAAIRDKFGGKVPDTIEELTSLPGVGRKTANLIVGDVYGKPAVVADTHFIRITNRLGLTAAKDPARVEKELRALLPPERSNAFCHRCVMHGRAVCKARKPECARCVMKDFCPEAKKEKLKANHE